MGNKTIDLIVNGEKKLIGRRKLTVSEVIDIGKKKNSPDVWSAILNNYQLNVEQIFEIFISTNQRGAWYQYDIWEQIISVSQLSFENLEEIGKILNNISFWKIIVKYQNISFENLLRIGNLANEISVWYEIVKLETLNPDQLVTIGSLANNNSIWKEVVFSNILDTEQLLNIGYEVNSITTWDDIVRTEQLDLETVNNIGLELKEKSIWATIIRTDQFLPDFFTQEELIFLGKKINQEDIWIKIVEFNVFDPDMLYKLGKEVQREKVWIAIVKTNRLSKSKLEDLALIFISQKKQSALAELIKQDKLDKDRLFSIGNKCILSVATNPTYDACIFPFAILKCIISIYRLDQYQLALLGSTFKRVLVDKSYDPGGFRSRSSFSPHKASNEIWALIGQHLDFSDFTRSQKDYLLNFGKEFNNKYVWIAIVKSNSFVIDDCSHEELLAIGNIIDEEWFWDKFLP